MAKLKREDLNQLSNEDLQQRLHDDSQHITKLQFTHAVNPIDNPSQLRSIRREIARIKTEIRKREIASAK